MSDWCLSVDFGTTSTCAAMSFDGQTEVVLVDGEQRMPSAVLSDPNGGLVVGKLAELQAVAMPDRLERNPKRRLGDGIFLLGGEPVPVIKAVAQIFRAVSDEATRQRGGKRPARLRLTHPARWAVDGVYARTLAEAVSLARLPEPSFVSEPVAAARYFARADVPMGSRVAVYDLGGGTFDTSVLARTEDGFALVGRPGGIPDLGGEDFDESVFRFVGAQLPADVWERVRLGQDHESRRIRLELRRLAREAKEALSVRAEWAFAPPAPLDGVLRITRSELEDLVRGRLVETIEELEHTIEAAGLAVDDLAAIYLAGGSSRIPLVHRMVSERFGSKVQMIDEPKAVVARGAALAEEADLAGLTAAGATASATAPPPRGAGHRRFQLAGSRALVAAAVALAVVAALAVYGIGRLGAVNAGTRRTTTTRSPTTTAPPRTSTSPPTTTTPPPPATTTTSTTVRTSATGCDTGPLQVTVSTQQAAAGTLVQRFLVTNTGTVSCDLRSYPLISAYGPAGPTGNSGGTALSLAVEPIPANFGDIGGAGSVVPLAPGGSAAFFLEWTSVSQGPEPCYEVDGIEFGAPQALSSARKTVPAALGTVCGGVLYESVMFPPSVTG